MELTPEYIKTVRFTVKRGNTYDAAEVDAFLDELLEAVTARQNRPDADTLAAVCTIRAEMTEQITRAVLEAEKRIAPCFRTKSGLAADFFGFYAVFVHKYLTRERDML